MELSKQIARFTAELTYEALPPAVVEMAKIVIMDWLGSAVGGSTQPPARMMNEVVRQAGGNPQATVIGFNEKTSVAQAALVNGAASHILELDDLHKSSILHPAAPIVPAAVAMVEHNGGSGRDLITAVVAGFEVGIRVAEAVTPSHYYYWHTTGTCGTFGAVIAAAKAAGLGEEEIIHAFGNAGSQAAGLWEFLSDGAMTKHMHPGKAAMNGILAAQLAGQGFTGAVKILEGEKGFFKATAPTFDPKKAVAGLGRDYRILGNSYKIYPSCRHTHGAVDLALQFRQEGLTPSDIEQITVKTYAIAVDLVKNPSPTTPYEAKFSLPYCVAAAMADGKLVLDSFTPERIAEPAVRALMARCSVEVDANINACYPERWPSEMLVTLKNGTVMRAKTEYPKGDPENPASAAELTEKFKALAAMRWDGADVNEAVALLNTLEDAKEISSLFER